MLLSCGSVPRRKRLWVMICGVSVEMGRHYQIILHYVCTGRYNDTRAVPKSQTILNVTVRHKS